MGANPTIIWLTAFMMLSIALFNVLGINVTKYANAAQRATIDTSRTLVIWIASCLLGLEKFYWQSIIGFTFLSFGTLLYNEIIVLPFWGFDENTKERLAEKNKKADIYEYMSFSPGAPYDANKNKRLLRKRVYSADSDYKL